MFDTTCRPVQWSPQATCVQVCLVFSSVRGRPTGYVISSWVNESSLEQQCLQPPSQPHHGAEPALHPPVERLYSCGHRPLPWSDGRVADSNASPNSPLDLGTGSSRSTTQLMPGGTVTSAQNPSSSKNQTRQYWVVAKPRSVLSDIISRLWFYWSTVQDIRQRLKQRPEVTELSSSQSNLQPIFPALIQGDADPITPRFRQ